MARGGGLSNKGVKLTRNWRADLTSPPWAAQLTPVPLDGAKHRSACMESQNSVRAITIRQPYAPAAVNMGRLIENRTWSTKSRGDLSNHVGVGHSDEQWLQEDFGLRAPLDPPRGACVAMCRLVDVVTQSADGVRG